MTQKKILIVDDDPSLRLGLQVRLNAYHYDVAFAVDGATSIVEARKAAGTLSSIPVIVLSGRDRVGNRERALKAGAKSFLQKPMENDELVAAIRFVLEENRHDAAVGCSSPLS